MSLPLLQPYSDIKLQKAYELFLAGTSQEKAAKLAKVPLRTVQRRCSEDGWVGQRQAFAATAPPQVPPVAAGDASTPPSSPQPAEQAVDVPKPFESRAAGMEAMLREWQEVVAVLRGTLVAEVKAAAAEVANVGKRMTRAQIGQYTTLVNNLATLDKKVWCVPDKIETKDTTPAPTDPIRNLTDDQLERELAAERERNAAAAERARTAASAGEEPEASVN